MAVRSPLCESDGHIFTIYRTPQGNIALIHGDHKIDLETKLYYSEYGLIKEIQRWLDLVHAYDEDEYER